MGDVINLDEYRKRRSEERDKPEGGRKKKKKRGATRETGKTSGKKPKSPAPEKKVD